MLNKIIDEAKASGALKSGQDIKEVRHNTGGLKRPIKKNLTREVVYYIL